MVAQVAVRLQVRLDKIEEVHEVMASKVDRHLSRIERDLGMANLDEAPRLILLPVR